MAASEAFSIRIPKTDWDGRAADMRSRLQTWEWHWTSPKGKPLVMDFTGVAFMEPWAIAMFAAYGLGMREKGVEVRSEFDSSNPANLYQVAMGLQEVLEQGTDVTAKEHWSGSHQNTGLHIIRKYEDLRRFKTSADRLTLQHRPDAADALRYAMDEICRNVIQHSASPIGGVAIAQHFPDDHRLQVAVCDLGQGVRASLTRRNPELQTDMEGLRLALLPHASGADTAGPFGGEQNSGLGLFCASELAWRARGSLWITSGRALLGVRGDLNPAGQPGPERVYRRVEPWPGTCVVLDFYTEGIPSLSEVLTACSDLAAEARKKAGPAGLDFVSESAGLEDAFTVRIREFDGDNDVALRLRKEEILPRVEKGEPVVVDFTDVRVPAQSFVHALLAEVFQVRGSLVRLSFLNCTPSARAVLGMVAAYASYRRVVGD